LIKKKIRWDRKPYKVLNHMNNIMIRRDFHGIKEIDCLVEKINTNQNPMTLNYHREKYLQKKIKKT